MTEGLLEIGKVFWQGSKWAHFPWRVGVLEAKIVVASDVTFGPASAMMQNFGCGMVAKSASVNIFNNGYEGWRQLSYPYRLKFSFDSFKAAVSDDHDFEEITGCACMLLLADGDMLCYEPRFLNPHLNRPVYKEPLDESLA